MNQTIRNSNPIREFDGTLTIALKTKAEAQYEFIRLKEGAVVELGDFRQPVAEARIENVMDFVGGYKAWETSLAATASSK